jgi:RIM-binding protein of the cytomatrix active zone.
VKQLTLERDQLVIQLEKSQDMLMNFQQELQQSESELQREREENRRLKGEQRRMPQDVDRGTKEMLDNKDRELGRLQQQVQTVQKERDKEKDRCEKLEKVLQQIGVQGDLEIEQWRKAVETERARADAAEKTVSDLQKRVQGTEKQMQAMQQQMAQMQQQATAMAPADNREEMMRMRKELDKAHEELKNGAVERERFQAQLEMLVQELEKNQVSWRIAQTSTGVLLFVNVCLCAWIYSLEEKLVYLFSFKCAFFDLSYYFLLLVFTVNPYFKDSSSHYQHIQCSSKFSPTPQDKISCHFKEGG